MTMEVLRVQGLCKHYPEFELKNVSFEMQSGTIMGFVGRNGAGKSTTLKSLLNFVHPSAGHVEFFGQEFSANEAAIKDRISFTFGGVNFYLKRRMKTITEVYRRFFPTCWDGSAYRDYLDRFELNEDKRLDDLSTGMRVKYALALSLSHGAQLLLFDEPTSGLDPVSRDDLLDVFRDVVADGKTSLLFSTQIMTDLEKCADTVTYIKKGQILASTTLDQFLDSYRLIEGEVSDLSPELRGRAIGLRVRQSSFEALLATADVPAFPGLSIEPASLESIMIHIERS